jgi:hypothetical protein
MGNSRSRWYVVSIILYLASGVSVLATAIFGYLFYFYYWQWRGQYNEQGRYFHEPDEVVFQNEAGFLIGPTIAFAILVVVLLLGARASRRKAHGVLM